MEARANARNIAEEVVKRKEERIRLRGYEHWNENL